MAESYDEIRKLRTMEIEDISQKDLQIRRKQRLLNYGLTDSQIDDTNEIVKMIISDDPDTSGQAMFDFISQSQVISNKIVSLLTIIHVQRIIEYLKNPYLAELALKILEMISESEFPEQHDLTNFIDIAKFFLENPKKEIVSSTINIIGNISGQCKEFRDQAFSKGIFHMIKDNKMASAKQIGWSLRNSFRLLRFDDLEIEEQISEMLIRLSENEDGTYRNNALKAFYYLELHEHTAYHKVVVDNRYISVLTDIIASNIKSKPKYVTMALRIISGCSILGNDCLQQIFDYDTINYYIDVLENNVDDDDIISFNMFLVNSLVSECDDKYVFKLVEIFCKPFIQNLLMDHYTKVYPKSINAIRRLFFVTDNPKVLAEALSENLMNRLSDLLFISNDLNFLQEDGNIALNILTIFENIILRLETDETTFPILENVLSSLKNVINNEGYDALLYDDSYEKSESFIKHATSLKELVQSKTKEEEE